MTATQNQSFRTFRQGKNEENHVKTTVRAFINAFIINGTDTCAIGFKYRCDNEKEMKRIEHIFGNSSSSSSRVEIAQTKRKMIEYVESKGESHQIFYNKSKFSAFSSLEIMVEAENC